MQRGILNILLTWTYPSQLYAVMIYNPAIRCHPQEDDFPFACSWCFFLMLSQGVSPCHGCLWLAHKGSKFTSDFCKAVSWQCLVVKELNKKKKNLNSSLHLLRLKHRYLTANESKNTKAELQCQNLWTKSVSVKWFEKRTHLYFGWMSDSSRVLRTQICYFSHLRHYLLSTNHDIVIQLP